MADSRRRRSCAEGANAVTVVNHSNTAVTATLAYTPGAALTVGSPIKLKIMAYEPETYYSAGAVSLNTTAAGR